MKILIFGASGMLGHRLMIQLSKYHEVYGTIRDAAGTSFSGEAHIIPMIHPYEWCVEKAFAATKPNVVINCIAAIPQRNPSIEKSIDINAKFPHMLASLAKQFNARLIHFSTDAVFSGKRGNYTENDEPDGNDTYALTKRLGEISDQEHVLTLRCCPIGRELNGAHSLVEWFLAQTGEVKGYTKAHFNPLSTHEIARAINDYVLPRRDLQGVYHIGGDVWSKWEILKVLNSAYRPDNPIEVSLDSDVECNRHLNTLRFQTATGYRPHFLHQMVQEMAADNALYEGVHA